MTVIALSMALIVWYFAMTQVQYRRNYNYDIADKENVYRLEAKMASEPEFGKVSPSLAGLVRQLPGVQGLVGVNESHIALGNMGYTYIYAAHASMPGFVYNAIPPDMELLGLTMVCGSLTFRDEGMSGVIIPESYALRLFGRADNLNGMKIAWQIANSPKVQVVGVYKDLDENSAIPNGVYHTSAHLFDNSWGLKELNVFVKAPTLLPPFGGETECQRAADELKSQLLAAYANDSAFMANYKDIEFRLTCVADEGQMLETANSNIYFVYSLAAFIILFIAFVVCFSISMSEAPLQMKTLSTLIVLGVSMWQVRLRILARSVGRALVAFLIALLFIIFSSHGHWAVEVFAQPTAVDIPYNTLLLYCMFVIALVIGALSGVYPAIYATRHPLTMAIRGRFALSVKGRTLRAAMLSLQFVLCFATTMYFVVVLLQNRYLFRYDYGFDMDNVLFATEITHPDFVAQWGQERGYSSKGFESQLDFVDSQILDDKDVDGVCRADIVPLVHYMYERKAFYVPDSNYYVVVDYTNCNVDTSFFSTLRIDVTPKIIPVPDGRTFYITTPGSSVVLAPTSDEPSSRHGGIEILDSSSSRVKGVAKKIVMRSPDEKFLRDNDIVFAVHPEKYYGGYVMVHLKPGADKRDVAKRLYDIRNRIHGFDQLYMDKKRAYDMFRFHDYETELNNHYTVRLRFELPVLLLSVCCLLVTLMGLIGVTVIERRYMQRSTAIRRVLGTTNTELMLMQVRKYGVMLVCSAVVGIPAGYWLSTFWVATFALQVVVPLWVSLLVFASISVAVLLLVVIMNIRHVNNDLTLAIKTE